MNLKQRVQHFWNYFMSVCEDVQEALDTQANADIKRLLTDINEQLKGITGSKMEIERSETGFYEMTFACGSDKTAQLSSALLKKDAPKELAENWIINAFRQPLSALALQRMITIEGKAYTGADFKVYYTINDVSKTLDIKVYCEGLLHVKEDVKERLCAHMLELFLGELEFEARISSVVILDEPADDENICLLPNLYEDICDIIVDQDWVEYHDPLSIYMAYKLDEMPVSETLRNDMKLIITTNAQLQEELLRHEFDTCKDFHELGGEYGFLYYETLYEDEKEALIRQTMEKEINDLLYPMSIARTMGGAVGAHYSYVDVAVFDQDAFEVALAKMNEKLTFRIYYKAFLDV